MVSIKHIFYTNQIHGGIISRLFFIHFLSLHALAHLAVKILLQIFLYEDLSIVNTHTSVGCISLQNAVKQDRTLLRNQYYENIPNI